MYNQGNTPQGSQFGFKGQGARKGRPSPQNEQRRRTDQEEPKVAAAPSPVQSMGRPASIVTGDKLSTTFSVNQIMTEAQKYYRVNLVNSQVVPNDSEMAKATLAEAVRLYLDRVDRTYQHQQYRIWRVEEAAMQMALTTVENVMVGIIKHMQKGIKIIDLQREVARKFAMLKLDWPAPVITFGVIRYMEDTGRAKAVEVHDTGFIRIPNIMFGRGELFEAFERVVPYIAERIQLREAFDRYGKR